MSETFYWHDYETFGADPSRDRPVQFAGLRTDAQLNVVGEPLLLFCRPANDFLPQPQACLVTGIGPSQALREGVPECELPFSPSLSLPESSLLSLPSLFFPP